MPREQRARETSLALAVEQQLALGEDDSEEEAYFITVKLARLISLGFRLTTVGIPK